MRIVSSRPWQPMAATGARNSCGFKRRSSTRRANFASQCARISVANSMDLVTRAIADHGYVRAHLVGGVAQQHERTGGPLPIWPIAPRARALPAPPRHERNAGGAQCEVTGAQQSRGLAPHRFGLGSMLNLPAKPPQRSIAAVHHQYALREFGPRKAPCAAYAAAIALVALIGNFSALHKAVRFSSRGRQCSVSQK